MTIRIYNSLTREKEDFAPINPGKVLFYNCGPTVYGEFHIGNARNFVVFDVVRRWLVASGYSVQYVQNITDVDDKIIRRAAEEGTTPEAIAKKYTMYFLAKLRQLGNMPATAHPKATEYIPAIVKMVESLVNRGHAYASADGSVWFDVGSFPEYGKLSRMPLDQMQQGERVGEEQQKLKRSPMDFSLWKAAKPGEPAWKSPWGDGRPGWHIECSCMAMGALAAETIDIHGGGVDLRFPHHENEIAQSECATGKPFARYWMHNGMLDIDGEKMAKSAGNYKTLDGVLEMVDALTLRYFLISGKYRDKLDFTEDSLHKCKSAVERLVNASHEARRVLLGVTADDAWKREKDLMALREEYVEAMNDDFNTPRALAVLSKLVTLINTIRTEVQNGAPVMRLARATGLLGDIRAELGLTDDLEAPVDDFDAETTDRMRSLLFQEVPAPLRPTNPGGAPEIIKLLIKVRASAREEKNFGLGDRVRDGLLQLGVSLEDKPGQTIWKRFR